MAIDDGMASSSRPVTGKRTRATPRPEGEQAGGHTSTRGEASPPALANKREALASRRSVPVTGGLEEATQERWTVVRATGRIQVDLKHLADDPTAHVRGRCGGRPAGCRACTVLGEFREVQEECTRAINAVVRLLWRVDATTVDRCRIADGRAPKGKEWKVDPKVVEQALLEVAPGLTGMGALREKAKRGIVYSYPLVRAVAPAIASGIAANIARKADQRWQTDRYDVLVRQVKRPPHFTRTLPIPVRRQELRVTRDEAGSGYVVSFNLRPGRAADGKAQYFIPVRPRDAYQRELLAGLASGNLRTGELQLVEDKRRPGRWYMRIAFTRKVDRRVAAAPVAVGINRGIKAFVAACSTTGAEWIYDGQDIVAYLQQIKQRRVEYQRQVRASGRVGHGRQRTLRPIQPLQEKGERWRATRCQTIARRLANWCRDQGATIVYIEDFEGIRNGVPEDLGGGYYAWKLIQEWPYYQLMTRLSSCLEEYGIETRIVPAHWISQRCAKCGHIDEASRDIQRWLFTCTKCGHRKHLDVNAGGNVVQRGEAARAAAEK